MRSGLDEFFKDKWKKYRSEKWGVLCNQASVNKHLIHIRDLLKEKKGITVGAFLGPQHGIRGEKQDNMKESSDFTDPEFNIPVFSLYSHTRVPTPEMMKTFDVLIIDLQDIGTRIYTFMYTMENCMREAKKFGKKVVVLDRANPIGGLHLEGNVLDMNYRSFVGQLPLCTRHGMTLGELAILFNEAFDIGCDLEVIPLKGWKRKNFACDWGRDWVPPSPNIPTWEPTLTFPGTVHFEGTNISEGRGTTKPFEWIGAPFVDADILAKEMNQKKLTGFYFRPIYFQPTYQKHQDQVCGGVQIHMSHFNKLNAFEMGIHLLATFWKLYPEECEWKKPPYEYVEDKLPIDVIAGTDALRKAVESGKVKPFLDQANEELEKFKKLRKTHLIYS
ncbi:MAG: exo-beta-N-acetylmuramidase NamZ domain-containing protein [Pseudomonadota bacterium]